MNFQPRMGMHLNSFGPWSGESGNILAGPEVGRATSSVQPTSGSVITRRISPPGQDPELQVSVLRTENNSFFVNLLSGRSNSCARG